MYMVAVEENDPVEIMGVMRELGLHAEVILRRRASNELLSIIRMTRQRHDRP